MPWTALRSQGILGINARNIHFTQGENPRRLYPLVDDKLKTKALCQNAGIKVASVLGKAERHGDVVRFIEELERTGDFVLKPAMGAMGNGIMVLGDATESGWVTSGGRIATRDEVAYHAKGIISGLYALGGQPDVAFAEERLRVHPDFEPICYDGVPDIRIVVYRGVPVMAMTRLPTKRSSGRANLHHGAVGAGIDLATGRTSHAVVQNIPVERHPDTGERVVDYPLPHFSEALRLAVRATDETGLGYVGADVVIDSSHGAVILELNARPGLAIQSANRVGLRPRLAKLRDMPRGDLESRIELGRSLGREAS